MKHWGETKHEGGGRGSTGKLTVAKKDFNFRVAGDNSVKGLEPEFARQEDCLLQIEAAIVVSLRYKFQIDDANGFFDLNQTSTSSSSCQCTIIYDRRLLDLVHDNLQIILIEGKVWWNYRNY